jgi:hypothetical protein
MKPPKDDRRQLIVTGQQYGGPTSMGFACPTTEAKGFLELPPTKQRRPTDPGHVGADSQLQARQNR